MVVVVDGVVPIDRLSTAVRQRQGREEGAKRDATWRAHTAATVGR